MAKAIQADNYFAIIPEWVLFSEISANAVRLYAVLRRYADSNGKCHPSRATLCKQVGVSPPTLSKAVDELVCIGALHVTHRKSKSGDYTSNQYLVVTTNPAGVVKNVVPPSKENDPTGSKENYPQTIAIIDQSQEPEATTDVATQVAKLWWESQEVKPLGKRAWYALLNVCKAATSRGFTSEQILKVLNDCGTVPSVAEMDRRLRGKSLSHRQRSFEKAKSDLLELQASESFFAIEENT